MTPVIAYPYSLDTDRTLFRVYNSTQSVLAEALDATSTKIQIIPQNANDQDVWPENGFVTLPDELIYYDATDKDDNGKVITLRRCVRGVEGTAKYHHLGTPIRGNVVAQHHNQLVDAIINIERTIGELSDLANQEPEQNAMFASKGIVDYQFSASLQQSLGALMGMSAAADDTCPQVEFEFNTQIPVVGGTIAEFCVRVAPWNPAWSYKLEFGDGEIETTLFQGTHEFASGGPFTPSVTISTTRCVVVSTPAGSDFPTDVIPPVSPSQPFHLSIPDVPDFPEFIAPRKKCPGPLMNLPPMLTPYAQICSETSMTPTECNVVISAIDVSVPSEIVLVGCCPPSVIMFEGCCPPSVITYSGCCPPSIISFEGCYQPSVITFEGCCQPSIISFEDCNIPSVIHFDAVPSFENIHFDAVPSFAPIQFEAPPSFTPIGFETPPSFAPIGFETPPPISVIWGVPPTVSCIVVVQCPSSPSMTMGMRNPMADFQDFQDGFREDDGIPVNFNDIGIPDKIELIVPKIPDINVINTIPSEIMVRLPATMPDIRIVGPEKPLPEEIRIVGSITDTIRVDASEVPKSVKLDASEVPQKIMLEVNENFPRIIKLEAIGIPETLKVTGIPKTIEVIHNLPARIELYAPEDLEVPLVYKGAPFEIDFSAKAESLISQIMMVAASK